MGVTAVDIPLAKIGKAAELLGVSVQTLRKWEDSGDLIPDRRSEGGVRYYDMGKIFGLGSEDMPIIGYASVSRHDQKMISFVSRNCSKTFVSQRLAS
jgi:predicted site-specific integrase-resolvase